MTADPAPLRPGRRPGRRPGFSLDDIARAALAVGFRDLTMTAVAERLGVRHSSLYRRVRGRDELVAAAIDRAVRDVAWPRPRDGWRDYLERTADAIWDLFSTYPGMAAEVRELPRTPPAAARVLYTIAGELTRHGFSPASAVLVANTVIDVATDVRIGWERLADRFGAGADPATARALLRERWTGGRLDDPAADPIDADLAAAVAELVEGDPRDWFHRRLALFLDGAERHRTG